MTNHVALWVLAFSQGALSFALGSTLIARIIATAHTAPTLDGSFATVAVNVGAVLGPLAGGLAVEAHGVRGPLLVSTVLVVLAVAVWAAASIVPRLTPLRTARITNGSRRPRADRDTP